jgi:hypothetical protein
MTDNALERQQYTAETLEFSSVVSHRTFAFAALPSVIGGPGGEFISLSL